MPRNRQPELPSDRPFPEDRRNCTDGRGLKRKRKDRFKIIVPPGDDLRPGRRLEIEHLGGDEYYNWFGCRMII
jgi:hypothetical protein